MYCTSRIVFSALIRNEDFFHIKILSLCNFYSSKTFFKNKLHSSVTRACVYFVILSIADNFCLQFFILLGVSLITCSVTRNLLISFFPMTIGKYQTLLLDEINELN
jgi:hypothetical protein